MEGPLITLLKKFQDLQEIQEVYAIVLPYLSDNMYIYWLSQIKCTAVIAENTFLILLFTSRMAVMTSVWLCPALIQNQPHLPYCISLNTPIFRPIPPKTHQNPNSNFWVQIFF